MSPGSPAPTSPASPTWPRPTSTASTTNGGINGRPIQYVVEEEQTNPQQVAALAAKLIQHELVLAIVGSTSLIDCTVNHAFYEQNNFKVIVAGVPFDCFTTPNIAAVNMGPYYSSEGAAQYLIRAGAKSIVAVGANVPGGDHDISGVGEVAVTNGIPNNGAFLENVPISDASAIAIKAAQAAGDRLRHVGLVHAGQRRLHRTGQHTLSTSDEAIRPIDSAPELRANGLRSGRHYHHHTPADPRGPAHTTWSERRDPDYQ